MGNYIIQLNCLSKYKRGVAMRKILLLMVLIIIAVSVCCFASCADNDSYLVREEILKQFDLSDEQEYWSAEGVNNFEEDKVRVVFKKTTTYPELSLDDFPLDNALKIEYVNLRPDEDLTNLDSDYLKNFRQIADIYLRQTGKDEILEAVACLEKVPFVKFVSAIVDYINPPINAGTPQIDEFLSIEKISIQFDVAEEKVFWTGSIDNDFKDDRVYVIFKRTYTYPELEIDNFNFHNAVSIDYKSVKPVTAIENCSIEYLLYRYRQIACIYLKDTGKDKVIEAIEYFQKLDFIKCAEPDINQYPDDDGNE